MTKTAKSVAAVEAALPALPEDDFSAYADAGMEAVRAADMLVPRLAILQALSPQLSQRKAEFIPGAAAGMIADLGTDELFPDGVQFLPVMYAKNYLEWAPRDTGRGLVAIHTDPSILDQCTHDDRRRAIMPSGNYIAETAQFFGLNLSANRRWCFVPMASTQLKKARRWVTLAKGELLKRADGSEFVAPLFYRSYGLTTAYESNNDGEWHGWVITRGPSLPELGEPAEWRRINDDALAFRKSLQDGLARADVSEEPHDQEAM